MGGGGGFYQFTYIFISTEGFKIDNALAKFSEINRYRNFDYQTYFALRHGVAIKSIRTYPYH